MSRLRRCMHNNLQNPDLKNGLMHRELVRVVQTADPQVGLVRVTALGKSLVIVGTPSAQHALMKQTPFMPKPDGVDRSLGFLVRLNEPKAALCR